MNSFLDNFYRHLAIFLVTLNGIDIYISRPLIGPAYPPLLTLVVMLPATIKQALAMNARPVYWFAPGFRAIACTAAGLPTMADERPIYLRCLCIMVAGSETANWRRNPESAQLSIKLSYSPSCLHVAIVLAFHKHNRLPLEQTWPFISFY